MSAGGCAEAVGALASTLGQAYQSARLYPAGHPVRQRLQAQLLADWEAVRCHTASLEIEFGSEHAVTERGERIALAALPFREMAGQLGQLGVERLRLEGTDGGRHALGFLHEAASGRRPESPPAPPAASPAPARPAHSSEPASDAASRDPRMLLGSVWKLIARDRRFDAESLSKVTRIVAAEEGDGVVEPVRLWRSDSINGVLLSHALNMGRLVYLAARSSGLRGPDLDACVEAALLCDIGMLAMPRELLGSGERLRPAEFRLIRKHPLEGARMLLATPGVPLAAGVVAFEHHRRRFDQGYPQVGRHTPPCALSRLVQAADVYAALRTPRAFRTAVHEREARALLTRMRGERLDEEAIDLLLDKAVPLGTVVVDPSAAHLP